MIKDVYSYRLRRVVTLLSSDEYEPIWQTLKNRMRQIQEYRKEHGATLEEARLNTSTDGLDLYESMTGVRLEHPEQLSEVLQDRYGRLCPQCEKPFRTPRARFCAECGYELPDGQLAGPLRE